MAAYLTDSPKQRGGLIRQTIEFVVCLTIAVLIYRSWYVEGYIVPTGSMATTLLGMHRQATCADCGYEFAVGTDAPLPTHAVCPNCGYPDNPLDVLPTICAAAGVSWPVELRGKDLMQLAGDNKTDAFHEAVPIECKLGRAIVRGSYKYIRFNGGARSEQLFDLNNDPHDQRNHVDDPELARELAACRASFEELFQGQSV